MFGQNGQKTDFDCFIIAFTHRLQVPHSSLLLQYVDKWSTKHLSNIKRCELFDSNVYINIDKDNNWLRVISDNYPNVVDAQQFQYSWAVLKTMQNCVDKVHWTSITRVGELVDISWGEKFWKFWSCKGFWLIRVLWTQWFHQILLLLVKMKRSQQGFLKYRLCFSVHFWLKIYQ